MAEEFQPITINTQEEMNALFAKRVEQAKRQYEGFLAPDAVERMRADDAAKISELQAALEAATSGNAKASEEANAKIAEYEKSIADGKAELLKFQKESAAAKFNLPAEWADRLRGDTYDEVMKDAEQMAGSMPSVFTNVPMRNPEASAEVDGVTAAFRKLNPNIKF